MKKLCKIKMQKKKRQIIRVFLLTLLTNNSCTLSCARWNYYRARIASSNNNKQICWRSTKKTEIVEEICEKKKKSCTI